MPYNVVPVVCLFVVRFMREIEFNVDTSRCSPCHMPLAPCHRPFLVDVPQSTQVIESKHDKIYLQEIHKNCIPNSARTRNACEIVSNNI